MNRIKSARLPTEQIRLGVTGSISDDNDNVYTVPAYTETGYQYDLNGNILNLIRKNAKGDDMDSLTYYTVPPKLRATSCWQV